MKKTICLLLSFTALFMILIGCSASQNNEDNNSQQLAQLEVYSSDGNLINTIVNKDTLEQFNKLNYTYIPSDLDSEQSELENKIDNLNKLYTIISYKEPVAIINNGSLEKLVEITIYEDSNIIKEQVAAENVKVAPISEKYLTFYMTISDEDKNFILSLPEI